ncbi:MAG TPA: hypothetical protein VGI39_12240 [Polyangiaceae bacterium]|jgi:hypothetical protein
MSAESPFQGPKFDVRVISAPAITPQGERFSTALGRAFGVDLAMAERVVRDAPITVKRGVSAAVANRVRQTLEILGAVIEVTEAGRPSATAAGEASGREVTPLPSLPVAPPTTPPPPAELLPLTVSTAAPPPARPRSTPVSNPAVKLLVPPAGTSREHAPWVRPEPGEYLLPQPPPRPSARPPGSSSISPLVTATVRPIAILPGPRASQRRGFAPLSVGALVLLCGVVAFVLHSLKSTRDAQLLGNVPSHESACGSHFGLTGPGLAEEQRAKLTLVVAWRNGCLSDDYRAFLDDLYLKHRGDVEVVAAGLAVPPTLDARGEGKAPQHPPEEWPPRGCELGFDVLPTTRGYVADFLAPPATYLYDADGWLIAVWRGGMSPQQREKLTAWIDQRPWER